MDRFVLFVTTALIFNLSQGAYSSFDLEEANEPLKDHFKDIIDLIPKEEIKNVTQEHLENDAGFRAAIAYMQSKEWIDLVEAIRAKPEWIELKKFLKDAGIDLDTGIRCIENLLENVTLSVDPKLPQQKKNLKNFIADVEMTLPSTKIVNLLEEKLVKGENFKILFDKLSSQESHRLVEKVLVLPEIRRALSELAEMGLDLRDMLALMYTVFGWGELKPFN